MDVLIQKKDVKVLSTTNQDIFKEDHQFTFEDGFNIAVAFTAYDNDSNWILNRKYGELYFSAYSWGQYKNGTYFNKNERIQSSVCTREQLGLVEDQLHKGEFLPLHDTSYDFLNSYQKKFLCTKKEDLYIFGDFDSAQARLININLKRCRGHDYCASEEEIDAFLMNKFLLIYHNQVRFEPRKYGDEAIVPESIIHWIIVNTQSRTTIPYKITTTKLLLQDAIINLDDITELEDSSIFSFDRQPVRSYEKDVDIVMNIAFERNLDMNLIDREGYTVLDYLSDMGGMQSIVQSFFVIVLSFWNYNFLDDFLVSKLFRYKKNPD